MLIARMKIIKTEDNDNNTFFKKKKTLTIKGNWTTKEIKKLLDEVDKS